MSKVIQWYISGITHPENGGNLSNYLPWRRIRKVGIEQTFEELKNNQEKFQFGHYTFKIDPIWHSWKNFSSETEIRIIDPTDINYQEDEINIFPIRFRSNEDQIFTISELCPFKNLPNHIIDWLRNHPDCMIVFHDAHEAKCITDKLFGTIPALVAKREHYNLKNQFVYLDSRANPEKLIRRTYYQIPKWLHLIGANHWPQFVGWTRPKEIIEDIKVQSKQEPLFDKGRFLMYVGRFRPTRYDIAHRALNLIPKEQLWLKLNPVPGNDNHLRFEDLVQEHMEHERSENLIYGIPNPWSKDYNEIFIKLQKKAPINTFPKELHEEYDNYQKLKYFHLPNPNHYSKAFIDISCETFNERMGRNHDHIFITEKICKPIWAGRPFITSGNAGTYNELKKLGFKTFDKWWGEHFAEERNTKVHIKELIDTIRYISSLSIEQCREMYYDMIPTLEHNQKTIENLTFNDSRLWINEIKKLHQRLF